MVTFRYVLITTVTNEIIYATIFCNNITVMTFRYMSFAPLKNSEN